MSERPVPLVLREPACGTYMPAEWFELSGIERVRSSIERGAGGPPFVQLSGLRFTDAGLGMATVAMPTSPWWQTGAGVFSPGVLAFVADSALGAAVLTSAPPRTIISTAALSFDFLRPATTRSTMIIARGKLIHATRSLGLSEVFIEDGRGRVLAHGTSRCVVTTIDPEAIIARRPSIGPPPPGFKALWERPVEGKARGQEYWDSTPGTEVIADAIASGGGRTPVALFTGSRIIEGADGNSVVSFPASTWFTTGGGNIYGGMLAYMADAATSVAVASTLPAATAFSPLDLKVSFLRPAKPADGDIIARATRVHGGRTIAVYNIEVIGPDGKLVATANESVLILPGRPWDKPVSVAEEATLEG
jgi:uncharacterized protein (TIGR00369 family)